MTDDDGTQPFGEFGANKDEATPEWNTPEWRAAMISKYGEREQGDFDGRSLANAA